LENLELQIQAARKTLADLSLVTDAPAPEKKSGSAKDLAKFLAEKSSGKIGLSPPTEGEDHQIIGGFLSLPQNVAKLFSSPIEFTQEVMRAQMASANAFNHNLYPISLGLPPEAREVYWVTLGINCFKAAGEEPCPPWTSDIGPAPSP